MASAQSSCFGVLTLPTFTYPFTFNPFVPKIITEHFPYDRHSARPWDVGVIRQIQVGGTTRRGFLAGAPSRKEHSAGER